MRLGCNKCQSNMFSTESSQLCQSRYFKEWHPDYIGSYNSINDPHLRRYFQHPVRRSHLSRGHQLSGDGSALSEREWRKQNLEWERRRRDAEEEAGRRTHQREVDERRARMVLRQQQKDEDSKRRRRERIAMEEEEAERAGHGAGPSRGDAVREAWGDQSALLDKISKSNRSDVEHLLNFLNFEIEYILRPRSAPLRSVSSRLHRFTDS